MTSLTYTIPKRANRTGNYIARCFRDGKYSPKENVDCGRDKTSAVAKAVELIRANM